MKTTRHYAVAVDGEQKPEWGNLSWIETTAGEDKDSIEVSRNASGGYSFSVKVYGEDMAVVKARVNAVVIDLEATYPAAKRETK